MIAHFHDLRSIFDDNVLMDKRYTIAEGFWPIACPCSAMRIDASSRPGGDEQNSEEWNENVGI